MSKYKEHCRPPQDAGLELSKLSKFRVRVPVPIPINTIWECGSCGRKWILKRGAAKGDQPWAYDDRHWEQLTRFGKLLYRRAKAGFKSYEIGEPF